MAYDPYGFESQNEERPPDVSPASTAVAGLSTLLWLGSAILYFGLCTGLYVRDPPEHEDSLVDLVAVWHILVAPGWVLGAIGLWTVGLHAVARRWWTSLGPNVLFGAGCGCFGWIVVLLVLVIVAATSEL